MNVIRKVVVCEDDVDLGKVKARDHERLLSLNRVIASRKMFFYVPWFNTGDSSWDQDMTLTISFPLEADNTVVDFRTVELASRHRYEQEARLVIHDKGEAATSIVVINGKFLVNVFRHRNAIQRYTEELPRGLAQPGDATATRYCAARNPGEAVVHRTIPQLHILMSRDDVITRSTKITELYKDPALHSGIEEVYLIEITIPDFNGSADELKDMLKTKNCPIHPKVRSLADVVNRKFHFKDAHSIAAIHEALPELESIVNA